jgi:hypothetical protein
VFLIEVHAAGPEAIERRLALQHGLVDALASRAGATDDEDRFAVEALVAATVALVTARLATGDAAAIRDLRDPLAGLAKRLGLVA